MFLVVLTGHDPDPPLHWDCPWRSQGKNSLACLFFADPLSDEFNGQRIVEKFPFLGPDRGQDAINDVQEQEPELDEPQNPQGPKKLSQTNPVPIDIDVQKIQPIEITKGSHVPIKKQGQGSHKKRNGDHARHNGIEQDADLEVQGLFAVMIDKGILVFVGQPEK